MPAIPIPLALPKRRDVNRKEGMATGCTIAAKNQANPTAMILSAVLLFRHLGESEKADRVLSAVEAVYKGGEALTSDLGGKATTTEFTEAVVQHLVN